MLLSSLCTKPRALLQPARAAGVVVARPTLRYSYFSPYPLQLDSPNRNFFWLQSYCVAELNSPGGREALGRPFHADTLEARSRL
jgi:hypothetical protein